MIKIRYSPPNELVLSGNADELHTLNREIMGFLSSHKNSITWEAETVSDPYPYEKMLSSLSIKLSRSKEKGTIKVKEAQLFLEGNKDFINNFACNLPYDVEDSKPRIGYHIHYDQISFPDILSEESLEIILEKESNCT